MLTKTHLLSLFVVASLSFSFYFWLFFLHFRKNLHSREDNYANIDPAVLRNVPLRFSLTRENILDMIKFGLSFTIIRLCTRLSLQESVFYLHHIVCIILIVHYVHMLQIMQ